MRTVNLFGAAILALSTSAYSFGAFAQDPAPATPPADTSTPAPDAAAGDKAPAKKPMHHMHKSYTGKGKLAPTKAGDKAVEDLNDASLQAAKDNKPFTPPPTPEAAKKEAHYGDKGMKPMKPHHHMKKAEKKADTAAPATDAAPPADAPK